MKKTFKMLQKISISEAVLLNFLLIKETWRKFYSAVFNINNKKKIKKKIYIYIIIILFLFFY